MFPWASACWNHIIKYFPLSVSLQTRISGDTTVSVIPESNAFYNVNVHRLFREWLIQLWFWACVVLLCLGLLLSGKAQMPSHDFVTPVFTWPRAAQSGSMLPPHVLNQLLLQTTETTPLVLQGTKVCGSVGRDTRLPRACGSVSFCARTSFGYRQQVNRTWCCLFVLQSLSSSHTEEGSSFWEPFFKAFSLVHLHPSGLLRAPRSPWTLTTSFWFNFSVKIMLKGGSFLTFGIVSCFTRINTFFGGGVVSWFVFLRQGFYL